MMATILSELWIYPVKGCRGSSLVHARLGWTGLAGDREFMVVDADGRFLSQRTHPRLALVAPRLEDDRLVLTAPGLADLEVSPDALEPRTPVTVWRDTVEAVSAGARARTWLEAWLGVPCDLVRMAPGACRPVDPRYADPDDEVSFADGFPVLLISQGSLDELNRRLEEPLQMDRFRPNLVVDGCPPFAEDEWSAIEAGDVRLRVAKPCARCIVTTIDQTTGVRGREPLVTLARFRSRDDKLLFGQNLVTERTGGLRVGEPVRVETECPQRESSQN
jgi:uncharacterized protein YcbX